MLGGLPVATGFGLRRAFGTVNNPRPGASQQELRNLSVSACVEATLPFDEAVRRHGANGGYLPDTAWGDRTWRCQTAAASALRCPLSIHGFLPLALRSLRARSAPPH